MNQLAGATIVSVFDPATGDTVQLNKISAEASDFDPEAIGTITTNSTTHGGHTVGPTVVFLDSDQEIIDQLNEWSLSGIELGMMMVGAGLFRPMYSYGSIHAVPGYQPNARDGLIRNQFTFDIVHPNPWYTRKRNLAVAFLARSNSGIGAIDLDSWTHPNGATITAATAGTLNDGITYAGTSTTLEIIIPVAPLRLYVSFDDSGSNAINVQARSFASSNLAVGTFTTEGSRRIAVLDLPSNTYKIRINAPGNVAMQNPSIRLDGKFDYTGQ